MICGVAEPIFAGSRALEMKMWIVFPRESHSAMNLDALGSAFEIGFGTIRLGQRGIRRQVVAAVVGDARGVVERGTRTFHGDEHNPHTCVFNAWKDPMARPNCSRSFE